MKFQHRQLISRKEYDGFVSVVDELNSYDKVYCLDDHPFPLGWFHFAHAHLVDDRFELSGGFLKRWIRHIKWMLAL